MNYRPYRNEETRTSVLAGVRAGAETAWTRFFDLYAGFVFSLGVRIGLAEADADDLVQTVFSELVAPDGFADYDRARGGFRPWLARRVRWRATDLLRRKTAESGRRAPIDPDTLPAQGGGADPVETELWIENARAEALRRLKEKASPLHFAVFHASEIEGLPAEDVLALHRISRDNLYQIRKRMKAAFIALLKAALDELDAPAPPER